MPASTWQAHFADLACYQQWAHERLFAAAAALSEADWHAPRGAFFGSLHHTLDHILLVTRLWRARLEGRPASAFSFHDTLTGSRGELRAALAAEFADLARWLATQPEARFQDTCRYVRLDGTPQAGQVAELLFHLFNHAAHHRGQASTLLTQLGAAAPEMDYVYYLRER